MPDFGSTVKSLFSKGMEAVGNAASTLASTTRFKVDELNLNNRKSEILRGFGARAYEMWKQGAQFPAELVTLLEQVAEADAELDRLRAERAAAQSDSAGSAEQAPQMIPRVGALRKTKFHVITSSAHLEYSYAYSAVLNPHSKFTYGLTQGVGLSGAMPCDKNGDGLAAMNELAGYIDACDDPVNPYIQHVQIYPANSDYALFFRGE